MLRPYHHTDWLLWLLFACAAVVVAARLYNPQRFKVLIALPFHVNRQEFEETFNPAVGRGFFDVSISLISYILLGLAFFLLLHPLRDTPPNFSDWVLFLRLTLVVTAFYLVKNLLGLLVGWVFDKTEEIAYAQNTNLAHRSWLGIILIPVCALLIFYHPLYLLSYYLLWVVTVAGFLLALQFSFLKLWKISTLTYYKIFYLCALEITPLLFLVGWLQSLYR